MATTTTASWESLPSGQPAEPERIIDWLDLSRSGLEGVKAASEQGDQHAAFEALVAYYRQREGYWYDTHAILGLPDDPANDPQRQMMIDRADATLRHVIMPRQDMLALGYEPHDYGPDIRWGANPHNNANWVATIHRFNWDQSLAYAWLATGDEKYANGWLRLARDWYRKMRPQEGGKDKHLPTTERLWYAYLPLQVGVRSQHLPADFELFKDASGFTPDALADVLAMVHNAADKTARKPGLTHHNPTIIEAEGLLRLGVMFPEFKAAAIWRERGLQILEDTYAIQVTPDGVQAEWGLNYHMGCVAALRRIIIFLGNNEMPVPGWMRSTAVRMYDHVLASLSPDRLYPMFSDARRPTHPIGQTLKQATAFTGQPKYDAVLDETATDQHPKQLNYAFPQGGFYFFRSGWGRDAIYMAVHCSPPARSKHDQPDNGTFELHAHGKWLMPDSGCYAYGHGNPESALRPWFGATAHHQTLTLDGADSVNAARHLMWVDQPGLTVAAFENASYPSLTHRRTIFFVGGRFFVLLDEAIGEAQGVKALHFQLAPGPSTVDAQQLLAWTQHEDDKNVLAACSAAPSTVLIEEEGWTSSQFHDRTERPAFCLRHSGSSPATFVTVILPFTGNKAPEARATLNSAFRPGDSAARIDVEIEGQCWRLARNIVAAEASCTPQ